jgi:hypothetical protein
MRINKALQKVFSEFLSTVPVARLKQNMTRVLLTYLKHESPDGLPEFMDDHFKDLNYFFEFLDNILKEMPRRTKMSSSSPEAEPYCSTFRPLVGGCHSPRRIPATRLKR